MTTIKKEEIQSKDNNSTFYQGSVIKVIIKLALPIVMLMLFNSLYNIIDTIMAAQFVNYGVINGDKLRGSTVMATIIPITSIMFALPTTFVVGGGLAYTQAIGRNDQVKANEAYKNAFSTVLLTTFITMIIALIVTLPYMYTVSGNWNNGKWGEYTGKMMSEGYEYMVILMLSFFMMNTSQLIIRILRTEGKSVATTVIPMLSMPINLGFDYLFMGVIHLGLVGAGLATFLASTFIVIVVYAYVYFSGKESKLKFKIQMPELKIKWTIVQVVFLFGFSSMYRRIFDGSINATLAGTIDNLGLGWHNAMGAMTRSMNMSMSVVLGLTQALAMIATFYYTNGDKERFKETVKYGFVLAVLSQVIISLLFIGIQKWIFIAFGAGEHWSDYSSYFRVAFLFMMLYAISSVVQLVPIMFYAATKRPKMSFLHTTFYGITTIISILIGYLITRALGGGHLADSSKIGWLDIILFAFIFIGPSLASSVTFGFFVNWFNKLLKNSKRLNAN